MKMYYHGEQAMTTLPDGHLGLNDLMELQHALESRDGGEQNLDDDMTVLPHVMPHTEVFQVTNVELAFEWW